MLRVLSLGAGVQSSTLLLMAARGEIGDRLDAAIFADTQWESRATYEHLRWLAGIEFEEWRDDEGRQRWRAITGRYEGAAAHVPAFAVTIGDIRSDLLNGSKRNAQPPFYVKSTTSSKETMIRRQCTKGYKIEPIQKKLRELLGLAPRQHAPKVPVVEQWMAISIDEAVRMKDSLLPWVKHRYPLIERGMSRHDCYAWLARHGYLRPPKSACIGCPYTDNARWREMRDHSPGEWADAVAFDRSLRTCGVRGIVGEPYLHRSLVPLDEVDLRTAEDMGQGSLFVDPMNAECEGMCGV